MSDEGWTPVLALEDLPDRRATRAEVGDTQVLLYRADDRIFAIGNRCTHQGAPLDRGAVKVLDTLATVTCPAHGSVFRLTDGAVVRAPAPRPVPAFETRVTDGTVELRPRA
ncbi:MAG TPA: Rieske (2Fe-2S) protein [Actinomycetota bacterium]|nr:Rieske (2Fe-2S) protein [Actinomycetota bacterium]